MSKHGRAQVGERSKTWVLLEQKLERRGKERRPKAVGKVLHLLLYFQVLWDIFFLSAATGQTKGQEIRAKNFFMVGQLDEISVSSSRMKFKREKFTFLRQYLSAKKTFHPSRPKERTENRPKRKENSLSTHKVFEFPIEIYFFRH